MYSLETINRMNRERMQGPGPTQSDREFQEDLSAVRRLYRASHKGVSDRQVEMWLVAQTWIETPPGRKSSEP